MDKEKQQRHGEIEGAPREVRVEDRQPGVDRDERRQKEVIMEVASLAADEFLQAQQPQPCARDDQSVREEDGQPVWKDAAQQNQAQTGGLEREIQRPDAQAVEFLAVVPPKSRQDEGADDVERQSGKNHRLQVQKTHGEHPREEPESWICMRSKLSRFRRGFH